MESEKFAQELDVAVAAVQMACALTLRLQDSSLSNKPHDEVSLVKIADWSVQATISWVLSESFGSRGASIVSKNESQTLSKANAIALLEAVVETVNDCLAEAPKFGLKAPKRALGTAEVLEAMGRCNSSADPTGRFWVLDPVDDPLGFVSRDQYAIALSLIEDGEVVLGVLGCPNYPMKKDWLSYHNEYRNIISKLSLPSSESWDKGCLMYARRGSGLAWMQPLLCRSVNLKWENFVKPVRMSSIDNPSLATFCEQVQKPKSSHSFTAGLAQSVGHRKLPLGTHGMAKYAAIARGDADVFMKFAKPGHKEKIWDHAAGTVIIQEAGGVVTDAGGSPLDFSNGVCLEGLDRGIISCAGAKLHDNIIRAVDASWYSSCL